MKLGRMAETEAQEAIIKSLPDFVNSFRNNYKTCLLCNTDLDAQQEVITNSNLSNVQNTKILKEICLKCIIPQEISTSSTKDENDIQIPNESEESFPFCKKCTLEPVSKLSDLYNQFQWIQREFNEARKEIARSVIKTFLLLNPEISEQVDQEEENNILLYWQEAVGINQNSLAEVERFANFEDLNEYEIKSEPIDEDSFENEEEIDDEPQDLISPSPQVLNTEKISVPNHLNPFVRLEQLKLPTPTKPNPPLKRALRSPKHKIKFIKLVPTKKKIEKNIPEVVNNNDSESESNEEENGHSNDDYQPDPNDLEDYEPSFELEIPIVKKFTRRNNTQLNNVENEEIPIIRVKRRYTKRNPLEPKPKKIKKPKKVPKEKKVKLPKKIPKESTAKYTTTIVTDSDGNLKIKKKYYKKPPAKVLCPHPLCGKLIFSKSALRDHMRIHTGERPFKCTQCPNTYKRKYKLQVHIRNTHTNIKAHICELCGKGFALFSSYRLHKANLHDIFEGPNVSQCEACSRKFLNPGLLKAHVNLFHNPNNPNPPPIEQNYFCKTCHLQLSNYPSYLEHKKTDEHLAAAGKKYHKRKRPGSGPDSEKIFTLAKYSKNISDDRDLLPISADNKEEDVFAFCSALTSSVLNVIEPPGSGSISMVHPNKRVHKCDHCEEEFVFVKDLTFHRKSAHPTKRFHCNLCAKAYASENGLKQHVSETHVGEQGHICEYCGKILVSRYCLSQHQKRIHLNEMQLKCKYCNAAFRYQWNLRRHTCELHPEIYLKDKPYVCKLVSVCYLNYATEEELERHKKSHERLRCSICRKLFDSKSHLTKHMRTHTQIKEFKCPTCDKAFTEKFNLKEHMYRHSNERPFTCEYCDAGFFRRKEMQKHIEKEHEDLRPVSAPEPQLNITIPFDNDKNNVPRLMLVQNADSVSSQIQIQQHVSDFSSIQGFQNYTNL